MGFFAESEKLNKTILMVNDNPDLLAKVGQFLEDFGYLVQLATDRTDALGKIKAFDPGMIVCQMNLLDGTAFQLIEELRSFFKSKAPVIIMASPQQIEYYRRKPEGKVGQAWIKWPVQQMELYNAVTEWLGKEVDAPTATPAAAEPRPAERPVERPKPTPQPRPVTIQAVRQPQPRPAVAPADQKEVFGDLSRTPIPRLLFLMAQRQETGVLSLNKPPNKMTLHLRNGVIVNVQSNYIADLSLGMLLAKKGEISARELNGARKRWLRDGGFFGEIAVTMDLVAQPVIDRHLIEQKIKKVLSLFSWQWQSGKYAFTPDPQMVEATTGFVLRVEPAVIEGVRSNYDMERLMKVFGTKNRMITSITMKRTTAAELLGKMKNDELQQTINALQRSANLQQAAMVCGLDKLRFLQYAYALYVLDLLQFS